MGYLLSLKKKNKAKLYAELLDFNEKLILNLRYEQLPIKDILEGFETLKKALDGKMESEDKAAVEEYFEMLGKTDSVSQIEFLITRRDALMQNSNNAYENYKRYGNLYIKIFFMVGILVAVLLA